MPLEWLRLSTVWECLAGLESPRDPPSLDPSARVGEVRGGPMSSTSTTSKKVRASRVHLVCRTFLFPDYGHFKILKVLHFQRDPLCMLTSQVNKKFHKFERVYRDCIKRTRDKTRIHCIPHDAPGT